MVVDPVILSFQLSLTVTEHLVETLIHIDDLGTFLNEDPVETILDEAPIPFLGLT
jgi:hypothetical protein